MKYAFARIILLILFLPQTVMTQVITEGAITFETSFIVDWEEYDSLQLGANLAEINSSEMSDEEKEKEKKEQIEFHERWKGKLLEWLEELKQETVEYVFNEKMAVAKRMQNGKPRDEFLTYEFDERRSTSHFFLKQKLQNSVVVSTPETASVNWSDIKESVRIDSTDTKEILGFKCVKYYLEHSHLMKRHNKPTVFLYELYVTDAFHLPFFIFDPAFTKDLFRGCPLEIKYINPEMPGSVSIVRASSFNPKIDPAIFEIPEKFKN